MDRERPRAYDLNLYRKAAPTLGMNRAQQRFVADTRALWRETSVAPPEERITRVVLVETPDGKVVSPEYDPETDIRDILRIETKSDELEAEATLVIRDFVLSRNDDSSLAIWMSPEKKEYGYIRGRIQFGFGGTKDGLGRVVTYAFPMNLSTEECLILAQDLIRASGNKEGWEIKTDEQLRANVLCLRAPEGTTPLDFLAEHIDWPKIWERIGSEEVKEWEAQIDREVALIVEGKMPEIMAVRSQKELDLIGAQIEWQIMIHSGRQLMGGPCGQLNYEILQASVFSHSHIHIDNLGQMMKVGEMGVFCRNCPYCGRSINAVIRPGYRCSCGQVYSGVC